MVTDQSPPPVTSAAAATGAVANGGGVNSPSQRRNLPSPWAAVVRGESDLISSPTAASTPGISTSPPPENASGSDIAVVESSGSEPPPENSDVNGGNNAGPARRPAWNRPVNGVLEPGSVMGGAVSWPALSESTRPGARSALDNSRPVSDGSTSSSQAPILSPPPQRLANNNAHANSTANTSVPARPRPRNRGGGGGGGGGGSGGGGGGGNSSAGGPSPSTFSRPSPPPPPPFPVYEALYGVAPPLLDASVRGARPVGGVGGGSQPHAGNDRSSPRSNARRGNYGPRPRGDGSFQNNHGGRRDQDRRDVPLSPQYVPPPMGYMPPPPLPPGATPFIAPQPLRVFPGPMGFDMAQSLFYVPTMSPESFRPMTIVPPLVPPMPFPFVNEIPLTNSIVQQIDYYFSDDNLVKDNFLRSKMDDHGWVPISLIAAFRRVQQLTNDVQVILEALKYSTIVEVQGEKLRRRSEWSKWLPSGRINSDSGSHSPGAAPENVLVTSLQELSLDDAMANANGDVNVNEGHTETATGRVLPEELTGQSKLANGEDTSEEVRSISE